MFLKRPAGKRSWRATPGKIQEQRSSRSRVKFFPRPAMHMRSDQKQKPAQRQPARAEILRASLLDFDEVSCVHVLPAVGDQDGRRITSHIQDDSFTEHLARQI